jgi:hypothetical protein
MIRVASLMEKKVVHGTKTGSLAAFDDEHEHRLPEHEQGAGNPPQINTSHENTRRPKFGGSGLVEISLIL